MVRSGTYRVETVVDHRTCVSLGCDPQKSRRLATIAAVVLYLGEQ